MIINLTDPANHPANWSLTAERIERVIEALESSLKYRNGSTLDHVLADAVKGLRELREVRKVVPVAWRYRHHNGLAASNWRYVDSVDECNSAPNYQRQPLYTAPPAPVVLDDLLSMAASAIEDLLEHTDPHTSYYSGVWADVPGKLRAAALQESPKGAGAPQNCRSNENAQVVHEKSSTSHAPEPVQSVDHVDGESCRGNSPVTPDGWKVEAERLAEIHGCSFVVFRHGEEPQCADPTKVIISFTDKGLGYADAGGSVVVTRKSGE